MKWLRSLLNIIPLFISLLVLDMILDLGFLSTIHLIFKISYIILISVFLINLIPLESLDLDKQHIKQDLWSKIRFFFTASIAYIHILAELLSSSKGTKQGIIDTLHDSIIKGTDHLKLNSDNYTAAEPGITLLNTPKARSWLILILSIFIIVLIRIRL